VTNGWRTDAVDLEMTLNLNFEHCCHQSLVTVKIQL